ncbi:GNAT family N-acetyltransferase [Lutimonas vermicola]|uniref:GNAT family N-acetyltransferase n=1 Tax=Lutimonas vermicola TaxID=414288 RepID=A0ABU9L0C7_9FLAO
MIKYRIATLEDNAQLLRLTNDADMAGTIGLRTDRDPSFFNLVELRGKSKVYIAEEHKNIVGSICVTQEDVYIQKGIYPLYYISDFKVAKTHRNQGIGLQLTNEVTKYLESENADFAFLNVAKGNKRPFVFFSERRNYPDFDTIGTFKIVQFIGAKKKGEHKKYNIEVTTATVEILDFLNEFYSKHELANVISKDHLKETSIFCVRSNEAIIAVMCLLDTSNMKQHLVLKMPWYLKLFISAINTIRPLTETTKLPKQNEPIKMLYLKYLAVSSYDADLIKELIYRAKHEVYKKTYAFVSFGLHENDPLAKYLPGFFKITFYSVGMLVSLKNSQGLMQLIKKGVPFKDFSTV